MSKSFIFCKFIRQNRGNPFKLYIFRHASAEFSELKPLLEILRKNARYKKFSFIEDAPKFFDCLTLVRHIYQKCASVCFSLQYIGNMPRALFSSSRWRMLTVDKEDLKCGDLIFLTGRKRKKLLGHIVIALGNGKIFQCNPKVGTAHSESVEECLTYYEQRLSARESLRYIDPRDHELRNKNKGPFIQTTLP